MINNIGTNVRCRIRWMGAANFCVNFELSQPETTDIWRRSCYIFLKFQIDLKSCSLQIQNNIKSVKMNAAVYIAVH